MVGKPMPIIGAEHVTAYPLTMPECAFLPVLDYVQNTAHLYVIL